MIEWLSVRNIALIEALDLPLGAGLNILSGETGAGKSIIIDSLNFVLGERADKSLIRYGSDSASVEAAFSDYVTPQISAYLDEFGIEAEDTLVIRRKMSVDGKNECRINGRISTLSVLKGLTELLVDIHGQHEHQSLVKPSNHLGMLDALGGERVTAAKQSVAENYARYRALKDEFARFGDEDERERKLDILRFQIEELEKAELKEGEEDELLEKRAKIRNSEKIISALDTARGILEGRGGASVAGELKSAAASLIPVSSYDERFSAVADRLDSAKTEIADIADTLADLVEESDFDAGAAERVEERLERVRALKRKYGGSVEAAIDFLEKAREEKDVLENASERGRQTLGFRKNSFFVARGMCAEVRERHYARIERPGDGGYDFRSENSFRFHSRSGERKRRRQRGISHFSQCRRAAQASCKDYIRRRNVALYVGYEEHSRGNRQHRHYGIRRNRHRYFGAHFRSRRRKNVQYIAEAPGYSRNAYACACGNGGQALPHRKRRRRRQDPDAYHFA